LKTVASITLAAGASLLAAAAPPVGTARYRVTPIVVADGSGALEVEIRFRGDADGETLLELPRQWAGSSELWRHVTGLEIRGAERLAGLYDRPVLHHRPRARLSVRYTIVSAWQEDPGFAYEKARPMVRPDWFFVHGEGLFAYPAERFAGRARFRWGKLPRGWRIASDLDHLKGKRTTIANMINSVAIGGVGLKVVERDIGGAPLRVAMLGDWSFEPEALADLVARIVVAADSFWGDRTSPFLVAMAPLGEVSAGLSYTGTGRTDAFSIASTSAFQLGHATRFLAHEYTHSWIPNELGALPEENEAADYWFSEGFDDYVAAKVLLRSGLWTLADFAADKNETLLRYGTSPARTADAAAITERFWTDAAVRQVSYDRGHLLAARLDGHIAARSDGRQSLDDVLRAQRKAAKGSPELASALFRKVLEDETGIDAGPDIERHARRGEPLLLPADLYGDCARIVTERRREFHRGFDSQATRLAGGVIAGVVPDGPAYAAGMRDGMRLVRFESGKVGDSGVEVVYRVADDGGEERLLRYLPEGTAEHEVQRVELTVKGPDHEARCKARLAGADRP
jgi:predicted metalloprotease with PDZ domain